MNAVIVDTNVIVIANDTDDEANDTDKKREDCRKHCQNRLKQIRDQRETVVVDNGWRIFREYEDNTHPNTRKGMGDLFVKRLLQNLANPEICKMVHITPLAGNGNDFAEFPNDDEALSDFHKKDRKFIAVAMSYKRETGKAPPILLAIDSGWLEFTDAFTNHGVSIDLICEKEIQRTHEDRRRSKK